MERDQSYRDPNIQAQADAPNHDEDDALRLDLALKVFKASEELKRLGGKKGKDVSAIKLFLLRADSVPLLSPEEERELGLKIRIPDENDPDGQVNARNKLIEQNLKLVPFFSRAYRKNRSLEDLISMGMEGLVKAADTFDPDKGRFSTHAKVHIDGIFKRSLQKEKQVVHVPNEKRQAAGKMRKMARALEIVLNRPPTDFEIATKMECQVSEVKELHAALNSNDAMSLNAPVGKEGKDAKETLADLLPGESGAVAFDNIARDEMKGVLNYVIDTLDYTEAELIIKFYGLNSSEEMSEQAIAEEMGISTIKVRGIIKKALRKLSNNKKRDELGKLRDLL